MKVPCFQLVPCFARNNQKYSCGSQGFFNHPSVKLHSFLHGAVQKTGCHGEADQDHDRNRFSLILRGRNSNRSWCLQCAAEAEMIALESLGVISNLDRAAVEKWLNSGELHRSKSASGSALICLNSLLARVQNTKAS
jgi:hypothetical protein